MKQIHIKMLKFLVSNKQASVNELSKYLEVTTRSITNYINEINHIVPNTIINQKFFYKVSYEKASRILYYYQKEVPQSTNERSIYIIKYLLDNDCYNIYDLADNLFVSYSTIKNDLTNVKNTFKEYNLNLENKNNILKIIGKENNKRKLLCNILSKELSQNKTNINKIFNNHDYEYIKELIFAVLQNYNYTINEFSLNGLTLHLLITIDRIRSGYKNESLNKKYLIKRNEYQMTQEIICKVEQKFNISFTKIDINETALLLISRSSAFNLSTITKENLVNFVGKKCTEIVTEMINELNLTYNFEISDSAFFIRLAIHVKNLLVRCRTNYFQKNPLKYNIKHDCPLIYETAIKLAKIITENTAYKIPEDEIAYLSFHVGNVIENQLKMESRLKVIIFYPSYYSPNIKIKNAIAEKFYDQIIIKKVACQITSLKSNNYDFMIAVCDELLDYINIPCVFISPFLSKEDISKINILINKLNYNKQKQEFAKAVRKIFNRDLFDINQNAFNKNQIIHQMSAKLMNLGFAKSTFENSVLEREEMSSTSCNGFAIPHTLKLDALKTCIYVKILHNGIMWDKNKVNLVLLLCFNKNDKNLFSCLFDSLAKILYDKENVKKLIKIESYNVFINTLIDMYR